MIRSRNKKGFTLVELLVVLSIVGLLSALVFVGLASFRGRSRDSVRKTTLKQLQVALELYRQNNGSYPATATNYGPYDCGNASLTPPPGYSYPPPALPNNNMWYSSAPGDKCPNGYNNDGAWIPGLVPTYLSSLPTDPRGGQIGGATSWYRAYFYKSDGINYDLIAHHGPEGTWTCTDTDFNYLKDSGSDEFCDAYRKTWAFEVCSSGGCAWP